MITGTDKNGQTALAGTVISANDIGIQQDGRTVVNIEDVTIYHPFILSDQTLPAIAQWQGGGGWPPGLLTQPSHGMINGRH